MFMNKLKTKLNSLFFTERFQIEEEFTTPFEEFSLREINKCLQKFICRQEIARAFQSLARQNCNSWQQ